LAVAAAPIRQDTQLGYDISVTSKVWDSTFNLLANPGTGYLAFDQWDMYYVDIPGGAQNLVQISLLATTDASYFKVYTRKYKMPTASNYVSMVPSSNTYSGNISVSILPVSSDLGGRWYIGVRFCRACNSQNTPYQGGYAITAILNPRQGVNNSYNNSYNKECSAELGEITSKSDTASCPLDTPVVYF